MNFEDRLPTPVALAHDARQKVFDRVPQCDAIITFDPANIGYLSGYFSMIHDFERDWATAAIATRNGVVLVTDSSDAAAASEVLDYERDFIRYGGFVIEEPQGRSFSAHSSFAEALMAGLDGIAGRDALIGLDHAGLDIRQKHLGASLNGLNTVNVTDGLRLARRTKLSGEIELIRAATRLVESGMEVAFKECGGGMTERDFSAIMCREIIAGGGVPRLVAVTSGPRAAMVDAYATNRRLERGDAVRLDIGCTFRGYWSDMARTGIVGEASQEQAVRYRALVRGLEDLLAIAKPGVAAETLFHAAVDGVKRHGIPHYRRHHCGHGIGTEIHEQPPIGPGSKTLLEPGMVLCVETPYYEMGWGGLMVEDTIAITASGYESLTAISRDMRTMRS